MEPIESNGNLITEEVPLHPRKTRKPAFWIILGSAALIVLAGAAFLAGRLLNQREDLGNSPGGISYMSSGPGGQTVSWSVTPSDLLPKEEATTMGIFQRKEDNSLYIGTGNIMMAVSMDASDPAGENSEVTADFDGPVIEVVVNRDTQIFQDITEMPFNRSEGGEVEQKLEPGSVDDIAPNSMVSVWGEKQGDRIIADVVVYQ